MLELSVLIVCHFTEMTSLDQHIFMTMQEVERTGDKLDKLVTSQPNRQHCRRFVRPWQKHWFLSKVAYTFDFVKSVYQALQRTLCTYVTNESGEIPGFVYDRQRRAWPQGLWQWWSTAWNGSTTEHRHCSSEKMTTACYLLQQLALQRCCHHLLLITNKVDVKLHWHWINCN